MVLETQEHKFHPCCSVWHSFFYHMLTFICYINQSIIYFNTLRRGAKKLIQNMNVCK